MVARIYYAKKMDKEAAQFLEKSLLLSNNSKSAPDIKRAYQQGGYRGLVSWQLHQLQMKSKSQFVSPLDQAILYAQLGNREQTFSLLEQSFRKHIPDPVFLQCGSLTSSTPTRATALSSNELGSLPNPELPGLAEWPKRMAVNRG